MTTSFTSPRAGFVEVAKKSAAGNSPPPPAPPFSARRALRRLRQDPRCGASDPRRSPPRRRPSTPHARHRAAGSLRASGLVGMAALVVAALAAAWATPM